MGIEEPKMMLGNGLEITDPNWIIEHLADFVDFTTAAQEINPNYTRHHIHKEIQMGRIFMGEILIIESPMMSNRFNQGKKFYITRTELDRIKAEIDARPERKILYCIFECGRQFHTCLRNPCTGRIKDGKSYRQTVEDAAEYFERFRTKAGTRVKQFSAFNRNGERKSFRNSKRKDYGGDNDSLGRTSDWQGSLVDDGRDRHDRSDSD